MKEQSLKERAYKHLRHQLVESILAPGSKISLAEVAKGLGMSHIPVREAVYQLCSEGFVEHSPSVGFFVRKVTRKELVDLFMVREALEVLASGQAAAKMNDDNVKQLEDIFAAQRLRFRQIRDEAIEDWSGPKMRELTMLDMAFHATILKAADNDVLTRAVSAQRVFSKIFGQAVNGPPKSLVVRLARVCRWHYRLLQAFKRRDVEKAKEAAAIHVREAGEHILACFDWSEQNERNKTLVPWASDPEELMDYVNKQFLDADRPPQQFSPHKSRGKAARRKENAI